jgi:CHAD domain-containing protein
LTVPDLPPDLLSRPAEAAVRLVALHHLDAAAAALARRHDPDDAEALHDFRVGLRRLRSATRAYRPHLKTGAPKRLRRRLRTLAAATNAGRDAEVLLAWLRDQAEGLPARERVGWRWLVARLEQELEDAAAALERIAARFAKLERRLRRRLASYRLKVELNEEGGVTTGATFGAIAADAIRDQAEDLARRLDDGPESGDPVAVHAARISAKRLRYLLEPVDVGGPVVQRLKALQDLLGELNDAHVASRRLADAVEAAGAERARELFHRALDRPAPPEQAPRRRDERPGLVTLARRMRERWDAAFARLDAGWLHGRAALFFRDVATLVDGLAASASRRPGAPESPAGVARLTVAARRARRPRRARRRV